MLLCRRSRRSVLTANLDLLYPRYHQVWGEGSRSFSSFVCLVMTHRFSLFSSVVTVSVYLLSGELDYKRRRT
ncbi:hypothetical protein E2C01_085160 [Portunus trituberculatus]|uniref:Uncharacterized protein n=1 Tax=Portunus trituberculatus TaxID=210409 RepID=A0A5B7J833_PORTR|nr:hypothetical protein [Portunus trituberculatus]